MGHGLQFLDNGCTRDILVPRPLGGGAVQRLSCRFVLLPGRNDGFTSTLCLIMRIAEDVSLDLLPSFPLVRLGLAFL